MSFLLFHGGLFMICHSCKNEIPDNSQFCLKCGASQEHVIQESPIEEPEVPTEVIVSEGVSVPAEDNDIALALPEEPQEEALPCLSNGPQPEALDGTYVATEPEVQEAQPAKKRFPLVAVMISIAALVIGAVVGVVAFRSITGVTKSVTYNTISQEAYLDYDGNAYFAVDNDVVKIAGDYQAAHVSRNGKHYVCLDADGTLYYFPDPEGERIKVDVDIDEIECVTDSAVFYATYTGEEPFIEDVKERAIKDRTDDYRDMSPSECREFYDLIFDDTYIDALLFYLTLTGKEFPLDEYTTTVYYKYTFETGTSIELVDAGKYKFTEEATVAAAIDNSNNIVAYYPDSDTQQVLCEVSESAKLINFDSTLSNVMWYEIEEVAESSVTTLTDHTFDEDDDAEEAKEKDDDTEPMVDACSVFRLVNGEKERLGDLGRVSESGSAYGCSVYSYFLNNEQDFLILGNSSYSLFLGGTGRETVKIDLPGKVVNCITDQGDLLTTYGGTNYGKTAGVESLLAVVDSDDDFYAVYKVDFTGERTKLLSKVNDVCDVYENSLLYIDSEDVLQICDWSDGAVNNDRRVTSEVQAAEIDPSGNYILMEKDMGNPDPDLYYVELDAEDYTPEKVRSNVYSYYFTENKGELYFIADAMSMSEDRYGFSGDLYHTELGGETQKITKDVVRLDSRYYGRIIATESPVVVKFSYIDSGNENAKIFDLGIIDNGTYRKIYGDVIDKYN